MDGFRVVKLNEVVRQIDILITCTGKSNFRISFIFFFLFPSVEVDYLGVETVIKKNYIMKYMYAGREKYNRK